MGTFFDSLVGMGSKVSLANSFNDLQKWSIGYDSFNLIIFDNRKLSREVNDLCTVIEIHGQQ